MHWKYAQCCCFFCENGKWDFIIKYGRLHTNNTQQWNGMKLKFIKETENSIDAIYIVAFLLF